MHVGMVLACKIGSSKDLNMCFRSICYVRKLMLIVRIWLSVILDM